MTGTIVLQSVITGLLVGCVYALVAAGLSLIFGVMDIVNFAHGEFLMLSMFAAFWLWKLAGLDPMASLPLVAAGAALLGVATYKGIIRYVYNGPMLAQVFSTFGLGVFLASSAQFLWTPNFRTIEDPVLTGTVRVGAFNVSWPEIAAAVVSATAFGAMYWFLARTDTGRALQATAEDKEAAWLMGIDGERMFTLGWAIGAACVGVAGAVLASYFYIFPNVGFNFALIAYVAVALGGFGSIVGSFIGGLVIGVVEALGGLLIAPAYKYALVFAVYLVVMMVRPQGLLGKF